MNAFAHSGPAELVRVFIALHPPLNWQLAFGQLQRSLAATLPDGLVRWTRPEQIHLTLRFLGDVPAGSLAALVEALTAACAARSRFTLGAEGLGVFPNWRQPRVLWLGLSGGIEPLQQLRAAVVDATSGFGQPEDKPFRPHLTLGRLRPAPPPKLRKLSDSVQTLSPVPLEVWAVERVAMMRSDLAPAGARHSALAEMDLA